MRMPVFVSFNPNEVFFFFNHWAAKTDLLNLSFHPHANEEPLYPLSCSLSALGLFSAVAPPWWHLHTCTSSLHVVGPKGPLHKDYLSTFFNPFSVPIYREHDFFFNSYLIYMALLFEKCVL